MRYLAIQILLLSLSFSTIGLANMSGYIDQAGTGHIKLLADFSDSAGKTVELNITGPLDGIVVKDRSGLVLSPRVEDRDGYTLVFVTVPVDYLEYDITSDAFTDKNGSSWAFDLALGSSENVTDFESTLQLPSGATITSTNGAVQQDGGTLSVSWAGTGLDPSKRAHLRAGYSLSDQSAGDPSWLIAAGIMLALGAITLVYLYRRKPSKSPPASSEPALSPLESNDVFKTLDETDKEIIREIHGQKGKTTQAHIYSYTHLPKATLSRRLASLENRGIIRKSQKGNRNLVTLTELITK